MTQAIKLKKDFEIAVSSVQDHIKNLSKNKLENEELISKLENEIKDPSLLKCIKNQKVISNQFLINK